MHCNIPETASMPVSRGCGICLHVFLVSRARHGYSANVKSRALQMPKGTEGVNTLGKYSLRSNGRPCLLPLLSTTPQTAAMYRQSQQLLALDLQATPQELRQKPRKTASHHVQCDTRDICFPRDERSKQLCVEHQGTADKTEDQ